MTDVSCALIAYCARNLGDLGRYLKASWDSSATLSPCSIILLSDMTILSRVAVAFLGALLAVRAAPAFDSVLDRRASITALSTSQINAFTPYTYYASAAYCAASTTASWSCGGTLSKFGWYSLKLTGAVAACSANSGFEVVASGGDGDSVQYCAYHLVSID